MAITNPDGTPYNPVGQIQQFDPESPEHNLFNQWDQELIRQTGSPIYYYEVHIQPQTVHPLYLEDRGKLWSPKGIQLWCLYEPKASQNLQGLFGIDAPDEMIFELNYREVLQLCGHPPKIGSRLFTPHKRENWIIIQRNDDQFKMWGQLRLQLICQKFQESTTDNSKSMNQPQPDFKLN
jgi:hypothetical protein